jgi:hypothetical protein
MSLLPFFRWCDSTWIGVAIRESRYLFPLIETVHLVGLTLLLATTIIISLRLFGVGMRRQPVKQLAEDLAPWTLGSLIVMLSTGLLLFFSEALKCYDSPPFRLKMAFLLAAILYQFTVYRRFTRSPKAATMRVWSGVVAAISLGLWFGVGLMGRAIGFY